MIDAAKARPTLHGRSRSRWPVAIAREERTTWSLPHRCRCRCRHRRCRQPRRNKATPIPITEDVAPPTNSVPEPGVLALLGIGLLAGIGGVRRRKA